MMTMKRLMLAAAVTGVCALGSMSANAFWGWNPFNWGGPWDGGPWYGGGPYGYPYGGYGYPYGGYAPYVGYAPYGWGAPYAWSAPGYGYPAYGYSGYAYGYPSTTTTTQPSTASSK